VHLAPGTSVDTQSRSIVLLKDCAEQPF
jgi:hypothetical protein